jgi:hypothetical protein
MLGDEEPEFKKKNVLFRIAGLAATPHGGMIRRLSRSGTMLSNVTNKRWTKLAASPSSIHHTD